VYFHGSFLAYSHEEKKRGGSSAMKIPEIPNSPTGIEKRVNTRLEEKPADAFKKMVDHAIKRGERDETPVHRGTPPPDICGVTILTGAAPAGFEGGHQLLLEELDQALDLVDFYIGKLSDKTMGLHSVERVVDQLEERCSRLRSLESDQNLPGVLKRFVSDLTLTMGKEIARFKRGDYS
jgi:hypothetical protein